MIKLDIDQKDFKEALKKMGALTLSPQEFKIFRARMSRAVLGLGRQNIKNQKTIYGQPFTPRKGRETKDGIIYRKWRRMRHRDGRITTEPIKKKLLQDILKTMHVAVTITPEEGKIGYKTSMGGEIAYRQQEGFHSTYKCFYKRPSNVDENNPLPQKMLANGEFGCTFYQAVALYKYEYKDPETKKDMTVDELMSTLTVKQAFYIQKIIKKEIRERNVIATNPHRPFLGVNSQQSIKLADWAMKNINNNLKSGKRLPLPDLSDSEIPF